MWGVIFQKMKTPLPFFLPSVSEGSVWGCEYRTLRPYNCVHTELCVHRTHLCSSKSVCFHHVLSWRVKLQSAAFLGLKHNVAHHGAYQNVCSWGCIRGKKHRARRLEATGLSVFFFYDFLSCGSSAAVDKRINVGMIFSVAVAYSWNEWIWFSCFFSLSAVLANC